MEEKKLREKGQMSQDEYEMNKAVAEGNHCQKESIERFSKNAIINA